MQCAFKGLLQVCGLALIIAFAIPTVTEDCDLANVQSGFYCADHEFLTAKDLVSNVKYYECEECEEIQRKSGPCEFCEEPMVEKISGKNVCPHCFARPEVVDVCVKSCFACPECGERVARAGQCADCEVSFVKLEVKALVEYNCEDCGTWSSKPGNCEDEECDSFDVPFQRVCSESGYFPHGN